MKGRSRDVSRVSAVALFRLYVVNVIRQLAGATDAIAGSCWYGKVDKSGCRRGLYTGYRVQYMNELLQRGL